MLEKLGILESFSPSLRTKQQASSDSNAAHSPERQEVGGKRTLTTPEKTSPAWRKSKSLRVLLPSQPAKRSLHFKSHIENTPKTVNEDRFLNTNVIDGTDKLQIKVLILNPSGKVIVKILKDDESKDVVKNIATKSWNAAANAIRNSELSVLHYRISTILFHSGVRHKDLIRLIRLGVSVSSHSIICLHRKMGENLESKVQVLKKEIELNRCTWALCEEVKNSQDLSVELDLTKETLKSYKMFTEDSFKLLIELMEHQQKKDSFTHTECLDFVIKSLLTAWLP